MPPLALYIHWPFCKKKCPYCDFNSHVRDTVDVARWQAALLSELEVVSSTSVGQYTLVSMFFGGGTPSLMPPEIVAALIEKAKRLFSLSLPEDLSDLEITLEANPTSSEAKNFALFQQAGVNRLSLGVQSLNDKALSFLGRQHSAAEALKAVELANAYFQRTSFDLIYALPEQSLQEWEAELRRALPYTRGHMSLYQLTIEENTAFHHAYHVKRDFTLPVEDRAIALYQNTQEILQEAGMPAYEISNHAAPGMQCRHNLAYWRGEAYLGIGPGAHGRLYNSGRWRATANIKSPERWLEAVETKGHGQEVHEVLKPRARLEEQLMMGLRLTEGIPLAASDPLYAILRHDKLALLQQQQFLEWNGSILRATPRGRLVLNTLIAQLLTDD